ncbi:MAG: hypothetical protein H7263_05990 [Candidatus Sericytochromatia bacterium]|nr:hypothetical protein [Candidatus Sericytochromatia bacterium]
MLEVEIVIKKWSNSLAVRLPKEITNLLYKMEKNLLRYLQMTFCMNQSKNGIVISIVLNY